MSTVIICREYAFIIMLIAVFIFMTSKINIRKKLLTNLSLGSEKTKLIINIICIPIVYMALFFCLWHYYPLVLDIPNVVSKSYCGSHAIAKSYDHANPEFIEKRYIDMQIDDKVKSMKYEE